MTDKLTKTGFTTEFAAERPYIVMSLEGLERDGKSTFALTAPGDIAIIAVDVGARMAIEKARELGKTVYAHTALKVPKIVDQESEEIAEIKVECAKQLEAFKAAYYAALEMPTIRTVIWDTASEVWELVRMAYFGKLTQVKPQHYGPVNAAFRYLIRDAYEAQKNLILIHKLKAAYVENKKTNRMERVGFSTIGYEVQISARIAYDREAREFVLLINDCRQDMVGLCGVELRGEMCSFPYLATMAYPETSMEDWQ